MRRGQEKERTSEAKIEVKRIDEDRRGEGGSHKEKRGHERRQK